jgi:hypothetical protein
MLICIRFQTNTKPLHSNLAYICFCTTQVDTIDASFGNWTGHMHDTRRCQSLLFVYLARRSMCVHDFLCYGWLLEFCHPAPPTIYWRLWVRTRTWAQKCEVLCNMCDVRKGVVLEGMMEIKLRLLLLDPHPSPKCLSPLGDLICACSCVTYQFVHASHVCPHAMV